MKKPKENKWYSVKDKLPKNGEACELQCEKGLAWGYYVDEPDMNITGWMINATERFIKGETYDLGEIIKWRKISQKTI